MPSFGGLPRICSLLATLTVLLSYAPLSVADIAPEEVVVLANENSSASKKVAHYYAKKRGLSPQQIITFDIPVEETISRALFDTVITPTLRKTLKERKRADRTRVLVSTFDMPLRVAAPDTDSQFHQQHVDAIRRRDAVRSELFTHLQELQKRADQNVTTEEEITSDAILAQKLQEAIQSLARATTSDENPEAHTQQMSIAVHKVAGLSGLLQMLRPNKDNEAANSYLQKQRQILKTAAEQLAKLEKLGSSAHRELVYQTTKILYGGIGVLRRANTEAAELRFTKADASFDSEISLLWWDTDMYPLSERIPNPWYLESANAHTALPILMSARLDGSSHSIAMGLVDKALEAESKGLEGTVYVDARGLKTPGDDFFTMDQKLRDFGWKIRADTPYDVYIENHAELLTKAKNAALYVGWYSVGQFNGEFDFRPGAIGYHIASSEAISVRDPANTGWCKGLLESGISATLGSVDEPYLDSFPEPQHFFGLMMTGKYTLVEAFYLSSRYLSWRMTLFGDPLYNPWRTRPVLSIEDLSLSTAKLPPAPGDFDFAKAFKRRQELLKEKKAIVRSLTALVRVASSEKGLRN